MPFGLGKSDKPPEDEGATVEETLESSVATPSAGSDNGAEVGASSAIAEALAADDQAETGKAYRPPTFRPDYLDEDAGREGAAASASAGEPPRGDTFFVSVVKQDGCEVHRFDDPAEAQAFVEELLEKEVPEEEIAAFSGRRLSLKVSRRPIVKLSSDQED